MNYRHAYHAGNFADVAKHAVLALVIEHLKLKPAPFRVIDTHAGIGLYDLLGDEAGKTGEWRDGIGRVLAAEFSPDAADALAPYLDAVRALNADGTLRRYPGSPLIARRLLRENDRLIVNELHPDDHVALKRQFPRDAATKVMALDGWTALKALLPPRERRGAVIVDPAYEEPGELDRLVHALKEAVRRFAGGTIILWYPIKDARDAMALRRQVAALALPKIMAVELMIRRPYDVARLNGAGLVIANAPFTLRAKLNALLPELTHVLAQGPGAKFLIEELSAAPA